MTTGAARLAGELTGASAPANTPRLWMEQGVVTSAVPGYLENPIVTVTWRDTVVPVSYVNTYTPVEGDVVLLLIQPPSVIVLGRVIGPEETT